MSQVVDRAVVAIGYQYDTQGESRVLQGIGAVALAVAGATAAAARWTVGLADSIDGQVKAAARIGATVQEYQRYAFAAERSGASTEKMEGALRFLTGALLQAREGTGAAGKMMRDLGIDVEDGLTGQLRTAADVLPELLDALGELEGGDRLVGIRVLLGEESGSALASLIDEGSAGLRALGDEAAATGSVLSDELADASVTLSDRMTNMNAALTGLAYAAGEELVPALIPLIESITELIQDSDGFVRSGIVTAASGMARVFEALATPLGQVTAGVGAVAAGIGSAQVATSMVGAMSSSSPAIAALGASLGGIAWPAVAAGAALVGTVLVVDDLATAAEGGDSRIQGLADSLGLAVDVGEGATWVMDTLSATVDVVGSSLYLTGELALGAAGYLVGLGAAAWDAAEPLRSMVTETEGWQTLIGYVETLTDGIGVLVGYLGELPTGLSNMATMIDESGDILFGTDEQRAAGRSVTALDFVPEDRGTAGARLNRAGLAAAGAAGTVARNTSVGQVVEFGRAQYNIAVDAVGDVMGAVQEAQRSERARLEEQLRARR